MIALLPFVLATVPTPLPSRVAIRVEPPVALLERLVAALDVPAKSCESSSCGVAANYCTPCSKWVRAEGDFRSLVQRLTSDATVWPALGPKLESTLSDGAFSESVHEGLMNLVAYTTGETSEHWAERLWSSTPNRFHDAHLIAFAERAAPAFLDRVAQRARTGSVRCAAYLAFRADDRGTPTLVDTLRISTDFVAIALAGAGLRELGREDAWWNARQRMQTLATAHLDAGRRSTARDRTLEAEYLIGVFQGSTAWPMDYSRGDWWGFDPSARVWIWKPGAADRLGTELRFYARAKAGWDPSAEEIATRIRSWTDSERASHAAPETRR